MNTPPPPPPPDGIRRIHWCLWLLGLAPVAFGLGNAIQDVDPAQYADVARRMYESGDWLNLRDMNGPFVNKPPMTMWFQAAAMAVFGIGAFAARLPMLAFGALALVGTWWAGRELRDSRFGAVAAALFTGTLAFQIMAGDPKVDLALTAFSALAVGATLRARRTPRMMWAAWFFAGCAMLSKGPIGVLLPMMAVGPELVRDAYEPPASPTGPAWLRLGRRLWSIRPLSGVLIVAALVAPFYLSLAKNVGPQAVRYLLWTQNVGRLNGTSGFRNDASFFFYWHTALWAFAPISPLVIAALIRRLARLLKDRALPADLGRVALWWFVLPLLGISSSTYKLPQYLYWSTPAIALLAADELTRLSEVAARWWLRSAWALAFVVAVGIGLALAFTFSGSWWWAVAAVLVPAAVAWGTRGAPRVDRLAAAFVAAGSVGAAFFHGHLQRSMLEYQPYEAFGTLVRQKEPTERVLPVAGVAPSFALAFYARRDPRYMNPAELLEFIREHGPRLVVFGTELPRVEFEKVGLTLHSEASSVMYPTSRARWSFLNAATRAATLEDVDVMRVTLTQAPGPAP